MVWFNVEDDGVFRIAPPLRCRADADDELGKPTAFVVACRLLDAPVDAPDVFTWFWSDWFERDRGPDDPILHKTNDILRADFYEARQEIVILSVNGFVRLATNHF